MIQEMGKRLLTGLGITALMGGLVQADGGANHRQRLSRPMLLGVSGGSIDDQDGLYCCGGTLGAVVEDAVGTQYVLSNNHVLGRTNRAIAGEDTVQPALIDTGCAKIPSDGVADFTEYVPIDFSNPNLSDAAIAQVRPGQVSATGEQIDIGPVSTDTVSATVGMNVQKDGRTTGHTTGQVAAVNVSVSVGYPKKCGGKGGPAAVYTDQIRITPGSFIAGGDSGSVAFEAGANPRATGLLFAGSSTSAIANRIENVLCEFSMPLSMAGGTIACDGACAADGDCNSGEICCAGACVAPTCSSDVDCDDGDACTVDTCGGGGTCAASCSNDAPACGAADGCCGAGCDSGNDPDCPAGGCGDGVCAGIANGEDCTTCGVDCRCSGGPDCKNGCCGDGVCDGKENVSNCEADCGGGASASARGGAAAVKERFSDKLFGIPDVIGHGVSVAEDGSEVIEVYLGRENVASRARIPGRLQGVSTRVVVTGPFTAY